jgi:hypothetical protein
MYLKLLNRANFIALILSYFYFSYLKIFYAVPYHIFFLTVGIVINVARYNYVFRYLDKRVVLLFILLFFIVIKSYLLYPVGGGVIKVFANDILINLAIVYYVFTIIRNEKDMVFFEKTIIYIGSLSILIAIFQFFNFDFSWELRKYINFSSNPDDVISAQLLEKNRPGGLAYYAITYSYQILILASIFVSKYFENPTFKNFMWALFGAFGLFVSLTRSSLFGFIIAVIFFIVLQNFSLKKLLITIILAAIFSVGIIIQEMRDISSVNNLSRYYLFLAGFNVFMDYIISGVGGMNYIEFTSRYMESYSMSSWTVELSVHNAFLVVLIKHGVFMLIPIFYLYYIYFGNIRLFKFVDFRSYAFFYVYMISYTFHSFFHNAGMFSKDQLFWIIFAYMLAVKHIHKNKLYNLGIKKKYASYR